MFEAGAVGYAFKRGTADEFICALLRTAEGVSYLDARIAAQADQLLELPSETATGAASLSGREFKIRGQRQGWLK